MQDSELSLAWWCMPVIPVISRQRQENQVRKAISGYIVCSKPAWIPTKNRGEKTQNFKVRLNILRPAVWEEKSQGHVPEGCELGPPSQPFWNTSKPQFSFTQSQRWSLPQKIVYVQFGEGISWCLSGGEGTVIYTKVTPSYLTIAILTALKTQQGCPGVSWAGKWRAERKKVVVPGRRKCKGYKACRGLRGT